MRNPSPFWSSLPERCLAGVAFVVVLPTLLFVALLVRLTAGSPIVVHEELPDSSRATAKKYCRFRTNGRGTSSFRKIGSFLRACSIDIWPGLWSVARGDLGLRDFLRLR